MSSIAEAFRTGGIWMYLVLMSLLSGLTLAGFLTIATAIKRRAPWVLWAIAPVSALILGLIGQYLGLREAFAALALATPETRMPLLARGLSLSLNVTAFGALSAALLSALGALGLGLGGVIGTGKPRQWTPLPALMAGGLGLLSLGGVIGGAIKLQLEMVPALGLFLIAGVLASVLANLSTNPEQKARIASLRLGLSSLLILGGASLGLGLWSIGKLQTFEALERAAPEMRLELLSAGLSLAREGGLFVGVGLVVTALIFSLIPALTSVKDSLDTRGLISAALGALLLIVGLGAIFASATAVAVPTDRVPLPRQAIELMAQTPGPQAPMQLTAQLAATTTDRCILIWDGQAARLAPGNTTLDAEPCQTDAMPGFSQEGCPSKDGELKGPLCSGFNNLPTLISPQLPAQPFLKRPWRSSLTQDFLVLLGGGASLSALEDPLLFQLSWQGLVGMQLELIAAAQGVAPASWIVQATAKADELKVLTPMQAQARMLTRAALEEELKRVEPNLRPALILAPDPAWTMQQLVDHCATLSNLEAELDAGGLRPGFQCKVWPVDEASLTTWHAARATPAAPDEALVPRLNGPLSAALIKGIIGGHQPKIRSCYEAELKKDPKLAGKVTLRFEIGAQGLVTQAQISADTTKNKALGRCIVKAARTWSFPAPDDGKPRMINYPFVFKAQ